MNSLAKAPLIGLIGALALAGCASSTKMQTSAGNEAASSKPTKPTRKTGSEQTIGGAVMDADATIADNLSKAPNLTTLVKAIDAAGLTATLSDAGPYTVLAPTNAAFERLAPGTVDTLLKPENKASLVKLLDYHVLSGKLTAKDIKGRIVAGGGSAKLATLEGDTLTATLTQNVITLTDVNGNKSYIQNGDVMQSNGIVHVVNGVLIPNLA